MADKIQVKRGLKANLPTLSVGEPAYCTDTKEFFVGTASGNLLINDHAGLIAQMATVNIALATKVDKVAGKGLSTNDYDNTEKAEVAKVKNKADTSYVDTGLSAKANKSDLDTTNANVAANTTSLAQKANVNDVRSKTVPIQPADLSEATLDMMTGTSAVLAYVEDRTIKPNKTSFMREYGNLFDKTKVTPNTLLESDPGSPNYGKPIAFSGYSTSELIPWSAGITSVRSVNYNLAFYDANQTVISMFGGGSGASQVAPSGTKFLRFDVLNGFLDSCMLFEETLPSSYVAYVENKPLKITDERFKEVINTQIKAFSPLTNKKWAVVGDSISDNLNNPDIQHYYENIAAETGCSIYMHGKSGTGYAKTFDTSENIADRIDSIETDSDYITIFAGTNDISVSLGTLGDTTIDTVYGAIDLTINRLITKFPNKKIGVFTPIPRGQYVGNGNIVMERADAIKEVCAIYSIPVLDLYRESGLRPYNTANNLTYFSHFWAVNGDGVHPNSLGHEWITSKIKHFVESL